MQDLLVDVCEVLADFATPALVVVSEVMGRPWGLGDAPKDNWDLFAELDEEQKAKAFAKFSVKGYCLSLEPKDGAKDFIQEARKLANVYAVTSPMHDSPFWVYERTQWLRDHFGFDRKHIVHTDAKYLCHGDAFLDDNPGHVMRWKERHPDGLGMMWSTTHNARLKGYEELRVHSWEEVLNSLKGRS